MFTLVNQCGYTVWPGILSNAGSPPLPTTGFALQRGQSKTVTPPASWGGRLWARTLCATDPTTGAFVCQTADCGSGRVDCAGAGAAPPATLAEFKLDGYGGLDFYDVSLVDGFNLPMLVAPEEGGSGGNCSSTGCVADLNGACPPELRVMSEDGSERVACRSACEAFDQPQYCCSGAYGNPGTCEPSSYSALFKKTCPLAYSYAYDDRTSTFTCGDSAGYTITFCPSPTASAIDCFPLVRGTGTAGNFADCPNSTHD
ncbi:Thaumatin-like protein 1 [Dionaea muscipula]